MTERPVPADREGTATPQCLFDLLNAQVKRLTGQAFELDAAASDWNAKCADYFDEETDALAQDWSRWRTIFLNPPFNAELVGRFVAKALEAAGKGSTVVLVLPAWPGYDWFQQVKANGQVQDVIGPVAFEGADGGRVLLNNGRRTTGIVVATLGPHVRPGTSGEPIRAPSGGGRGARGPDGAVAEPPGRGLGLRRLCELTPRHAEWLWEPRIPRGELTVVDGDPSVNKSSLLLDLAARVSAGRPLPGGGPASPGGVLLLPGEDSVEKTVLPRLRAAGADLGRVAVPERAVEIPRDLGWLERAAVDTGAALVVVDPLTAFLGCDATAEHRVRRALTPLRGLAERTGAAVVLVRHLTKRGGRHALYRGVGSVAIAAAARSALLVGRAPGGPRLRVLCQTKNNLGPEAAGLLFEAVPGPDGAVRVEWRGECGYTPDDLLGPPPGGRRAGAEAFLAGVLAGGPRRQREVRAAAEAAGLAYRTLERARGSLGVVSERRGWGRGSACYWRLPDGGGRGCP
jgi:phage N-6-adenine-methyltransferase